jgi:uncharacterized membrane protein
MSRIRSFVRDERGAIAVLSGMVLSLVLGVGAFGVDVGRTFADRRKAQSAADLAAIAAATDIANASRAAGATLDRNRLIDGSLREVVTGVYTADASVAPAERFKPSNASGANAVRVAVRSTTPLFLGRLLTGKDNFEIRTSAIATQTAFASFAVGSGLLWLEGGMLNQMLGGMLGTTLSLSVMDYQALLNAHLDMFKFADALAARIAVTGGTYNSLAATNVKVADAIAAMVDTGRAAHGNSSAVQALNAIAQGVKSSTARIPLGSLAGFGPYGHLAVGQNPQAHFAANALDMVSAIAQIANGQNQAAIGLDVKLPGISQASLRLAIGERPRGTSWAAVGGPGASAHTAQTRLLLDVTLLGAGSVAAVRLPVYLELASASATLDAVSCGFPSVSSSTVTLGVRPAVLDARIGNVTPAMMTNFSSAPNPGPAALVDTALLKVTGRAHATVSNLAPQNVTFSHADIGRQTKKTVATTDYTASLLSKLIGDLDLGVSVLGLGLGLPGAVQGTVAGIVSSAAKPLDQLLSGVLAGLGVRLGQAHVWTTGIRCDGAVLVN